MEKPISINQAQGAVKDYSEIGGMFDGELVKIRDLVGKTIIIKAMREMDDMFNPGKKVQLVQAAFDPGGKLIVFWARGVIKGAFEKIAGQLPIRAAVSTRKSAKTGREYYILGSPLKGPGP